ncbi:MAG: GrpB family protein [Acidimicrobiales bacterium]
MGRRTVDLVDYDPGWPAAFERERAALAGALGPTALVIEHIGSTAVPGLVAKPTIDIAVGVHAIADLLPHRPALEGLGYEWRAGFHADHLFLRKIAGDERTHHLHVIVWPSDEFEEWIAFRDLLRNEAQAAAEYAAVKRELAARHYNDRGAYVEAKSGTVRRLLATTTTSSGDVVAEPPPAP